jgi:hypothetical protein
LTDTVSSLWNFQNCVFQRCECGVEWTTANTKKFVISDCTVYDAFRGFQGASDDAALFCNNCSFIKLTNRVSTQLNQMVFTNCVMIETAGINFATNGAYYVIDHCTFLDNQAGATLDMGTSQVYWGYIRNSIFSGSGNWAIKCDGSVIVGHSGNCCFYNNTSGDFTADGTNASAPFWPEIGYHIAHGEDVFADPMFVNETTDAWDVRLKPGSPCLAAGDNRPQPAPNYLGQPLFRDVPRNNHERTYIGAIGVVPHRSAIKDTNFGQIPISRTGRLEYNDLTETGVGPR